MDSNIWGLLAMPLGVAICFGPVLVLWIAQERRDKRARLDTDANPRRPEPPKPR